MNKQQLAASLLAMTTFGVAATSASAQDPESRSAQPPVGFSDAITDAIGANYDSSGRLWAGSSSIDAVFENGSVRIVTPHSKDAERTFDLRYSLTSFGRDGGVHEPAGASTEHLDGTTVTLSRPGIDEVYEIRKDGLKQSFVLHHLPRGNGDLVVRGNVETDLLAGDVTADGLVFEMPGVAKMQFGQVIGYDAVGQQVVGSMSYSDGTLDFTLPAAFVDQAVLPVTVDPLIGTRFQLTNNGMFVFDTEDPDVAYDASRDRYLIAYRVFIGSSPQIRALSMPASGTIGNLIAVTSNAAFPSYARVANINVRNAFLLVWEDGRDIYAAGIGINSATHLTSAIPVTGGGIYQFPDVGGEFTTIADDAVVIYRHRTNGTIFSRQVEVRAAGTIRVVGTEQVVAPDGGTWTNSIARISKSGGPTGRFLVTLHRIFTGGALNRIRGIVISRNQVILDPNVVLGSSSTSSQLPDNDGDGTDWVVAYTRTATPGGDPDVVCVGVHFDSVNGARTTPERNVEAQLNDRELDPCVAWLGDSAVIGFADETSTSGIYDVYMQSINPFNCQGCERPLGSGEGLHISLSLDSDSVAVASRFSGGVLTGEALFAWEQNAPGANTGTIMAHRYDAIDGAKFDLGGGCGSGGEALAACARVGHSDFELRLRGAPPLQLTFAVFGFASSTQQVCGSCTLFPDLNQSATFLTMTNGRGQARIALPLPNDSSLRGLNFWEQWIVPQPSNPCMLNVRVRHVERAARNDPVALLTRQSAQVPTHAVRPC